MGTPVIVMAIIFHIENLASGVIITNNQKLMKTMRRGIMVNRVIATIGVGKFFSMVIGKLQIPDNMFKGMTCKQNHGASGQTIRHASNGECMICRYLRQKERDNKRMMKKFSSRNINALHAFEDMQDMQEWKREIDWNYKL